MQGQLILARINDYLHRANEGAPGMSKEVIEEAAERFKQVLNKTFNETRSGNFRVYMSNAGKPACQMVMERMGAPKEKQTAAFRMKMLIGDIAEITLRAIMKSSGVPVNASNIKVELPIAEGISLRGEYDFDIGGSIWDTKSSSNWGFKNKWGSGFSYIEEHDNFGYVAQLYGYSEASKKPVGGWVVLNKETGELMAVDANDTPEYRKKHLDKLKHNVFKVLDLERPFTREFQDEEEKFYGKPTGNRLLGYTCSMCEWRFACWPGLLRKPKAKSEARNRQMIYYTQYSEDNEASCTKEILPKKQRSNTRESKAKKTS